MTTTDFRTMKPLANHVEHQPEATPKHTEKPVAAPRPTKLLIVLSIVIAVSLAGALAAGTYPRLRQQQEVNSLADSAANDPPGVAIAIAKTAKAQTDQVLPGNAAPLFDAAIFARTTGYLKQRYVDIGDRVTEGQLLAVIATPEIDDQLEQSRATLLQTRANLLRDQARETFAQSERNRNRRLRNSGSVSQEDFESTIAQANVATANVHATESTIKVNEADIHRLETLQGFQRVVAPFAGVITARNVDAGDLIPADNPNTTKELFHLMRTDTLRVFANVPQTYAIGLKVGQSAVVFAREDPGKTFMGKVTRTSDALDPATRTLLTEVQIANPENRLRPGMYLQVRFLFDRHALAVVIPTAALATRSDGPKVFVLDNQNQVHYRPVQLGRDYGAQIEIVSGLADGERVVVHPGDDLPEGSLAQPTPVAK
ncbi:efflux RND transporter periplasmic adaptor subunit [soil metagenome]